MCDEDYAPRVEGMGRSVFKRQPDWAVEQLDLSTPGIIEGNYG